MDESLSQGRRFDESPHPYRTAYQRDRDRVIHTKAFRRLENKTQVFAADYSDHFRNRLTHTIEVTQIARTVARALDLNADLCEALALSHDIGHPPFSHEGEDVLDELMRGFGLGFDHNLHALIIVEGFERRYAAFPGLNLTFEVREGIVKHSRDYGDHESYLDLSAYRLAEKPPLEAQLIDKVDEIAYNTADLDDGCDSGLLSLEETLQACRLPRVLNQDVQRLHPHAPPKILLRETLRRLMDALVTSLIENTRSTLRREGIQSLSDVRGHDKRLVGFDRETAEMNLEIKRFLKKRLYDHPTLRSARDAAGRLIRDLFQHFLEDPRRLPEDHRSLLRKDRPERVICNYIAGMTDNYARRVHRESLEPGPVDP